MSVIVESGYLRLLLDHLPGGALIGILGDLGSSSCFCPESLCEKLGRSSAGRSDPELVCVAS